LPEPVGPITLQKFIAVESSTEVVGAYMIMVSSWDESLNLSFLAKKVLSLLVFHEAVIGNAGLILAKGEKEKRKIRSQYRKDNLKNVLDNRSFEHCTYTHTARQLHRPSLQAKAIQL